MSEYKRQTGNKHKIKKDSIITSCTWDKKSRAGCVGYEAKLSVETEAVKNGSNVVVIISDKSGKVNDTVEGKIQDNKFTSTYTVNEESVDCLTLKANLADGYELEDTSSLFLVLRPIKISLIDEYKNELDSHKTFHGLPYEIITDTKQTYIGTVKEREITHNIHYKDEYELELLYQSAEIPDTPIETLAATNDEEPQEDEDIEKASGNKQAASQTASASDAATPGANSLSDDDFNNYVVNTFEKIDNPINNLDKQINKLIG